MINDVFLVSVYEETKTTDIYNIFANIEEFHSHQTLKKAVSGKNSDVYEEFLGGVLPWL